MRRTWPLLIATTCGLGCAASSDRELRQAWLVDALLDDNKPWLGRDLDLLRTKYDRMEEDVYDFMRGTAGVMVRDWARAGAGRDPTEALAAAGTGGVLLLGDPHPENLGALAPGAWWESADEPDWLALEIHDLDGAAFGPYVLDVRRAAVGLALALGEGPWTEELHAQAVGALALAYADELQRLSAGRAPSSPELAGDGIEGRLRAKARADGTARVRYRTHTTPTPEGPRLVLGNALDDDGRGLLALTELEARQVERLLDAWRAEAPAIRIHDAARRYGQGVSSLPAVRYVALVDEGRDTADDDALVQLREVVDPPLVPGLTTPALPGLYADQADRVVQTAAALWTRPDADARYTALIDGGQTFKLSTWTAWHAAFDHHRIAADLRDHRTTPRDVEDFGAAIGRRIARAHALAPSLEGPPPVEALAADTLGRTFAAERVRDAEADLAALHRDHGLFTAARAELGPLLGAELLVGP